MAAALMVLMVLLFFFSLIDLNFAACFDSKFASIATNANGLFFTQISAASDGTLYGVTVDFKLYRFNPAFLVWQWILIDSDTLFKKIAVGSADIVYGINFYGWAYKLTADRSSFLIVSFSPTLSDITVGVDVKSDATVFAIDTSSKIYKLDPNAPFLHPWQTQLSGALVQMDVGAAHGMVWEVMGVNAHGMIYRRSWRESGWTQITKGSALTQVSLGYDALTTKVFYGINANKNIYTAYTPDVSAWKQICGSAFYVTVVDENLFYIINTADRSVYRSTQVYKATPSPTPEPLCDSSLYVFRGEKWGMLHLGLPPPDCPGSTNSEYPCQTGCNAGGCPSGFYQIASKTCFFWDNELCCRRLQSAHSQITNQITNEVTNDWTFGYMIELNIITSTIVTLICVLIFWCVYRIVACKRVTKCGIETKEQDMEEEI